MSANEWWPVGEPREGPCSSSGLKERSEAPTHSSELTGTARRVGLSIERALLVKRSRVLSCSRVAYAGVCMYE